MDQQKTSRRAMLCAPCRAVARGRRLPFFFDRFAECECYSPSPIMNVKTLLLSAAITALVSVAVADPIPEEYKQNGFAIGAQAYTFNRFTAFEAIEKTAQAGGKVIEFFPGQKLSKEEPNLIVKHGGSDEVITKLQAKLKEHG